MAKKVRRTKEFLRRSRAAKLGWKRRLERQDQLEEIDSQVELTRRLETKDKRIAELERINKANLHLIEFIKKASKKHIDPDVMKKFNRDGNIAFQWSTLRHVENAQEFYDRLVYAKKIGRLDEEAAIIAKESHTPIQEVYTLFHSP